MKKKTLCKKKNVKKQSENPLIVYILVLGNLFSLSQLMKLGD